MFTKRERKVNDFDDHSAVCSNGAVCESPSAAASSHFCTAGGSNGSMVKFREIKTEM
jgi:hypothetical protein